MKTIHLLHLLAAPLPAALLIAALCASCSGELPVQPESPEGGGTHRRAPLIIASAALQAGVEPGSETRTGTAAEPGASTRTAGYTPLTSGSIGVFMSNSAGASGNTEKANARYNYGTPQWVPAADADYLALEAEGDVDVCAYYPYNAATTDKTQVDVSAKLLADGEQTLAYATNATKSQADRRVAFSMKQACARLTVNFTRGNLKDDCTLSTLSLVHAGLVSTSKLNIATGAFGTSTTAPSGKITFTEDIALPKSGTAARDIALPPATLSGGLRIEATLKEYGDKTVGVTLPTITALARGTRYSVNLTMNATDIEVTSVQIETGWEEADVNK